MPASSPRSAAVVRDSGAASADCRAKARSPWVWWHLLSLDAPTVAVVWCWFFGATFGAYTSWTTLTTVALGTWWVYVADRLLDGWRSTDTATLRDRHWFYLRHRRAFAIAWLVAAAPLAYLIFFRTQAAVRAEDVLLCTVGVGYFLLVHGRRPGAAGSRWKRWMSKELAVGFLFALATAAPAWAEPQMHRGWLAAAILTFGAACWLNCVAIQTWEDREARQEIVHTILSSRAAGARAPERGWTQIPGEHLTAFALAVGLLGLGMAAAAGNDSARLPFAAVAASGFLFLVLIRNYHRFRALPLRIAADLALLTPLLLLLLRVR